MKNYAFIFARGGSKGLLGKNIKPLLGKPLLAYSIETAKETQKIEKVFVSTDDDEIAKVALQYDAILIRRPAELATDFSSEWGAWRHAISWVVEQYGDFDNFVSLPATSPLRSVVDVETAIDKLVSSDADICISITEASRSPYFNMVTRDSSSGHIELVNQIENGVCRRQDAPEVFDITTVVYATTPKFVLANNSLFEGKVTSVVVPKARAVDIDDIYDFKLAEAILLSESNK